MPENKNLNQRIRQALYALKREYGAGPVSVYTFSGTTVNKLTGVKSQSKDVTVFNRVIILPAKLSRDQIQTISSISANKQFVYGGQFDARTRNFIFERRDAANLVIDLNDWLVFNGRKYEIKSVQEFDYATGYVVTARQLVGEVPEQIFPVMSDDLLQITSVAEGIL